MKLVPNPLLLFVVCSSLITGCSSIQSSDIGDAKNESSTISDAPNKNLRVEPSVQVSSSTPDQLPKVEAEIKPEAQIEIQQVKPNVTITTQPEVKPQIETKIKAIEPESNKATKVTKNVSVPNTIVQVARQEKSELVATNDIPKISSVAQINSLTNETPPAVGESKKPYLATSSAVISTQYFGLWTLTPNWDGEHPGHCGLFTPTMQINQDNYSTQVWLDIIDDKLLVNTSTNIDINKPGVGIKANDGQLQLFAKNRFASNVVWSGSLANTLKANDKLNIILGGNELGRHTQEMAINLADLKKAYPSYQKCK